MRSLRLIAFTVLFKATFSCLSIHYCVEVSCISKCAITPLELSLIFIWLNFVYLFGFIFVFVKTGLMYSIP